MRRHRRSVDRPDMALSARCNPVLMWRLRLCCGRRCALRCSLGSISKWRYCATRSLRRCSVAPRRHSGSHGRTQACRFLETCICSKSTLFIKVNFFHQQTSFWDVLDVLDVRPAWYFQPGK